MWFYIKLNRFYVPATIGLSNCTWCSGYFCFNQQKNTFWKRPCIFRPWYIINTRWCRWHQLMHINNFIRDWSLPRDRLGQTISRKSKFEAPQWANLIAFPFFSSPLKNPRPIEFSGEIIFHEFQKKLNIAFSILIYYFFYF